MPGVKFLFQNLFNLIKFLLIEKRKPCKSNALLELQFIILKRIDQAFPFLFKRVWVRLLPICTQRALGKKDEEKAEIIEVRHTKNKSLQW